MKPKQYFPKQMLCYCYQTFRIKNFQTGSSNETAEDTRVLLQFRSQFENIEVPRR